MPKPETTNPGEEAIDEALKRIGDCIRRRSTVLDLSKLRLRSLPPKILQIPKLTELDLSHNRLQTLPPELGQFTSLTRLDISNNPLVVLSPEIGQLVGLTRLDLTHTPLKSLPAEIGRLADLTRLYLDHNRLETLPPELGQLANLTRLYLSHNALTLFPTEISRLARLTRLDLSHNRLQGLPPEIGQLTTLTVLEIAHNALVSLPSEIGLLPKLSVLKLSNNQLTDLPTEIGQTSNLTELDINHNALHTLPESLRDLENLERLFLHENPALQISPSILGADPRKAQGAKAAPAKSILDFYFGRQSGKTRSLDEVRLILLGSSGAGKTSIVQAMRDLPFRERETRTPGIALCDWTMEGAGEKAVTAHVWDFAGDPLTHALHPYFFSPRSLFVVVLGGRDHRERADAEYWLQLIQEYASNAEGQAPPVIVALNQWNVPGCRPEVDRGALRERYPFIRGFVEMDCKGKKGMLALKTTLFRELDRMPWVREPFPTEWDAVRQALGTGKTRISVAEYRDLCLEHGVMDEGQQEYLLDFLHHLGAVFHDTIDSAVLQPGWLTKHLYPLLHRADQQAGILNQADVDMVLITEKDPSDRSCLMKTLENFGLASSGQAASGALWLLPHAQPKSATTGLDDFRPAADAVRLRYTYPTLAKNLVAEVIVRRFDFIEELRDRKCQWHDGVILARKGARALFQMESSDRQLTITVIGPVKTRHQLADLCQAEMNELHTGITDLDVVAEIQTKGEWAAAS